MTRREARDAGEKLLKRMKGKGWKLRKRMKGKGWKLRKRMKGKGWKLRVWENLGWHYWVENTTKFGVLSLNVCAGGLITKYYTLLGEGGGGEMFWTEHFYTKDPNKAVKRQMKIAEEFVAEKAKLLATLRKRLAG